MTKLVEITLLKIDTEEVTERADEIEKKIHEKYAKLSQSCKGCILGLQGNCSYKLREDEKSEL
jgi:tetrahydromethanopterin S-methyltransferase subunit G